ncbi:hypothetical protein GDO81_028848 [Engystomops pustulosus]|uniref:Uncharacterized protein n=1 Tax=Engystomops pustulosus TaxID=76066 RepID=A0AAV6YW16_ENGPU|nr:hypothetical protein GDO81_028848 [Engystomops pustulosus]
MAVTITNTAHSLDLSSTLTEDTSPMAKTCIFPYVAQKLMAADSIVPEGHSLLWTLYSMEIHCYLTNLNNLYIIHIYLYVVQVTQM